MKRVIILLGIPGSGKGTQAKSIAQKYGYIHISTGDLLRSFDKDSTVSIEDKKELEKMKAGEIVSDELIYRLAFKEIESHIKKGEAVVLDGAIRNVKQAERYQVFFEQLHIAHEVLAIELSMKDVVSFERLSSRLKDGTGAGRMDDTMEALKERLKSQGNVGLSSIVDYYRAKNVLVSIDGERTIDEVNESVEQVLEQS